MFKVLRLACLSIALVTGACAFDHDPNGEGSTGKVEQRESWGSIDTPSNVDPTFVETLASLPTQGESIIKPWVGTTWLTQQDSINQRWEGAASQSPASKYQSAFGGTDVADKVSLHHGIDAWSTRPSCTDSSQCSVSSGEVCAKRNGATSGRCLMSAWSMSRAWAAASILSPEPRNPVTVNGVTFKVQDIKALATVINDPPDMQALGSECGTATIAVDTHGRPTSAACRDTNAGAFHVALTNSVGLQQKPFVIARNVDGIAQHHPAFRYAVLEQRAISLGEAWQKMGPGSSGSASSGSSSLAQGAWWQQAAIAVTPGMGYRVAMTGTGDADLYVNFGAQPNGATFVCRPYLGNSTEVCEGVVPAGATQLYVGVHGYTAATFALNTTTHPSNWTFQSSSSLQYVRTRLSYVAPSVASLDGSLSSVFNDYVRDDEYEYILEVDTNGKVIGGEWIGDGSGSKKSHPDFLWWPGKKSYTATSAGGRIANAHVDPIVEVAGKFTYTPLTHSELAGSLAVNEWKVFGPYAVRPGSRLEATTTGTGDLDLYVSTSGAPTFGNFVCRPYTSGSSETCDVAGSLATYVGLHGYTAATYSLTITYTPL